MISTNNSRTHLYIHIYIFIYILIPGLGFEANSQLVTRNGQVIASSASPIEEFRVSISTTIISIRSAVDASSVLSLNLEDIITAATELSVQVNFNGEGSSPASGMCSLAAKWTY